MQSNCSPPPNFSLQLTAGRSPGSGLKPLFSPEPHGVTPLADRARRRLVSCGKRRAALPLGRGASPQLSERAVSRARISVRADAQAKERENGSAQKVCREGKSCWAVLANPGEAAARLS
jgi:hypothetical protein